MHSLYRARPTAATQSLRTQDASLLRYPRPGGARRHRCLRHRLLRDHPKDWSRCGRRQHAVPYMRPGAFFPPPNPKTRNKFFLLLPFIYDDDAEPRLPVGVGPRPLPPARVELACGAVCSRFKGWEGAPLLNSLAAAARVGICTASAASFFLRLRRRRRLRPAFPRCVPSPASTWTFG